jgi:hypothetical protein
MLATSWGTRCPRPHQHVADHAVEIAARRIVVRFMRATIGTPAARLPWRQTDLRNALGAGHPRTWRLVKPYEDTPQHHYMRKLVP